MKLKKAVLILLSIFVLGLSFHSLCEMARDWLIASNYGGYSGVTLTSPEPSQRGSGNSGDFMTGEILGQPVLFDITAKQHDAATAHRQPDYLVWYNPGVSNMFSTIGV